MSSSPQWETFFERSGFIGSPRYTESMEYFKRFEEETEYSKMFSIGMSPQGRSIECIVTAAGNEFTPLAAKRSGKAIVLIQNGIHAGEIEGKDACMLMLRDIVVTKKLFHLLDNLILVIIPILNVDGHELISPYNRPNQQGPVEMGWRTNSWNLNLNRDYVKADTPEIQAFLRLFNAWRPDFFIDNHATNGADYQYHVTYALERYGNIDSGLSTWGSKVYLPALRRSVEEQGFLTAPYIQTRGESIHDGIVETPAIPRLSTGYAAVQNRLGLLVETHSLKPFENRVRSTIAMNVSTLELVRKYYKKLLSLNRKADKNAASLKKIPVRFTLSDKSSIMNFKGFESSVEQSPITGSNVVSYSRTPAEFPINFFHYVRSTMISVPKGYLIPKEFTTIVQIVHLHGIIVDQLFAETVMNVEELTFDKHQFSAAPYEGRHCVEVQTQSQKIKKSFPKGTFIIHANQRTNRLIVNLFEPESPDSLVRWGFFNAFFERKEYAEPYVMEPIAKNMLRTDKGLKKIFEKQLLDESFRGNPAARLDFFYRRSPYFDRKELKYPIVRLI